MKNLAGVEDCDVFIREELEKAGIDIYNLSDPANSEVPYSLVGGLGAKLLSENEQTYFDNNGFVFDTINRMCSFTFKRAWYYWVVQGYVSLDIAVEMYENPNGKKDIRVAGHCGCPNPCDWKVRHKVCGMNVVDHWHIDSQEGLNYFVQTLKSKGLV